MEIIKQPLFDYGKIYSSQPSYAVSYPNSIESVQGLVQNAVRNQQRLRVRASGHTFNGCTLPRENELLIRTDRLDWYRFDEPSTITVGAGVLVWDIRDMVLEHGFQLPVYNGGWAGPTLGGYINAGGFGKGSLSEKYGGLWENVLSITFIDGLGEVHHINRDDSMFKWLFSSYGQLGVIVEAKLKLIPKSPFAALTYSKGNSGHVKKQQQEDPKENDVRTNEIEDILFWFSLLVAPEQEAEAWETMDNFCDRHQEYFQPNGGWAGPIRNNEPLGYHYNINFNKFNPPLLYPYNKSFIVMGVMGFLKVNGLNNNQLLLDIEADFIQLAKDNNYKLYLQAENIGKNINYAEYYGDEVFSNFKVLKNKFDPHHLINMGTIFSY